ncbi:MAG: hypothetical protein E7602_04350 [Ruminococcaceae bacterium]|nr:hypothetical protein [Oscillospiraceae bacterium]
MDLNIVSDGTSDFIIVYQRNNQKLAEVASDLSQYFQSAYGVSIPFYENGRAPSPKTSRIVLGSASTNYKFIEGKLAKTNDFIIDVCGDDLFLTASSERLYPYLLAFAKNQFFFSEDKNNLVIEKDAYFSLKESEYKDINYAEYYKSLNGSYDYNKLTEIFKAETYTVGDTTIPYRIYVPSDYDQTKKYPVLTILHGAGERGNDNVSQLVNMVSEMFNQENSKYVDAIIICPQCPGGQQWVDTPWANGNYSIDAVKESNELSAVMDILEGVGSTYSTDTDRYYVMGISMGGFGAWDMVMRHTDVFSKAVCLCGGGDVSQAGKLVNTPIWVVHSSNDTIVPYEGSEAMSQAIKDAGGELCVFETKNSGHNVWSYAGSSTDIANWLLG